jgi:hypothetical protein
MSQRRIGIRFQQCAKFQPGFIEQTRLRIQQPKRQV